jgi:hypothetical protein
MKTALLFGLASLQIGMTDEINSEVLWVLREKKKKTSRKHARDSLYLVNYIYVEKRQTTGSKYSQ